MIMWRPLRPRVMLPVEGSSPMMALETAHEWSNSPPMSCNSSFKEISMSSKKKLKGSKSQQLTSSSSSNEETNDSSEEEVKGKR
jgi:hypothetical protein